MNMCLLLIRTFLRSIILHMFSEVLAITLKQRCIRNMILEHSTQQDIYLNILITIVIVLLIITRSIN